MCTHIVHVHITIHDLSATSTMPRTPPVPGYLWYRHTQGKMKPPSASTTFDHVHLWNFWHAAGTMYFDDVFTLDPTCTSSGLLNWEHCHLTKLQAPHQMTSHGILVKQESTREFPMDKSCCERNSEETAVICSRLHLYIHVLQCDLVVICC